VVPSSPARDRKSAAVLNASRSNGEGKGEVQFRSYPTVQVILDGIPLGSTPLPNIPITAGSHRVTFINGHRQTGRNFTVGADDVVYLEP
jgi:hypothetical protein